MMASESPIAQVPEPSINTEYDDDLIYQQNDTDDGFEQDAIPQILKLDLRGSRVDLDRDTLVNLPESLLIAMFPNGLILGGKQDDYDEDSVGGSSSGAGTNGKSNTDATDDGASPSRKEDDADDDADDDDDEGGDSGDFVVTFVDFDPICLEYVLQFYRQAQQLSNERQQRLAAESASSNTNDDGSATATRPPSAIMYNSPTYYPLMDKQPIIVLREELEYFCVPSRKNLSVADMAALKLDSGYYLCHQDEIFAALQKSIARENNMAEQHLIDMLCDAGFSQNDRWGHRSLEPMRTCIISMGLVLLNTTGPHSHTATAQKLLLFWRKPAVSLSFMHHHLYLLISCPFRIIVAKVLVGRKHCGYSGPIN